MRQRAVVSTLMKLATERGDLIWIAIPDHQALVEATHQPTQRHCSSKLRQGGGFSGSSSTDLM